MGDIVIGFVFFGCNVPHLGNALAELVFLDRRAKFFLHYFSRVKTVFIHHHPDQLLGRGTFIELHRVKLVGQRFKVFDGIRALLAESLQGQIKGHCRSAFQDRLEFIDQVILVQKTEAAHKNIDTTAATFDPRHLDGHRIIDLAWPSAAKPATGVVTPLLSGEIIGGSGGLLLQPVIDPSCRGNGRGKQKKGCNVFYCRFHSHVVSLIVSGSMAVICRSEWIADRGRCPLENHRAGNCRRRSFPPGSESPDKAFVRVRRGRLPRLPPAWIRNGLS